MGIIWKSLKKLRNFTLYTVLKRETNGARMIIKDGSKLLLVKHPYNDFWVFPGGGIKKNEDPADAAIRETLEETGFIVEKNSMKKLGTYFNTTGNKKDRVTIFLADSFSISNRKKDFLSRLEIEKMGWFNINDLPDISQATSSRIQEVLTNDYSDEIRKW